MSKTFNVKDRLNANTFLDTFEKERVKKESDIVALIESFDVKLVKKGSSYMGLCPFHDDKNPSLSVDRDKGLFHCFGCGASGDVFDFLMKIKGIGFSEAVSYLKPYKFSKDYIKTTVKKTIKHTENTEKNNVNVDLSDIAKHYNELLLKTPEGIKYLQKRGIKQAILINRFLIGYCDGLLPEIISKELKEKLKEVGLINSKETEHFKSCLVFPLYDIDGNIVSFYGRSLKEKKHLYLPGTHKGIFNRVVSKGSETIILTESIIDALSLIELGIENVQAVYGVNGFTEEHLSILKNDLVKDIVIAFDNDEAGKTGSEKLKEKLLNNGFSVHVISPQNHKDWNEEVVNGISKDEILKLIEFSEVFQADKPAYEVKLNNGAYEFIFSDSNLIYKVLGAKIPFGIDLKVHMSVVDNENKFYDHVNLLSHRSRAGFCTVCGKYLDINSVKIEHDLHMIVEYFDKKREQSLIGDDESLEPLTAEEEKEGIEFLKRGDLLETIAEDMELMGYVGDDEAKKLVYLSASSRVMSSPVSVIIRSESSSGKSYLIETVEKLIPSVDVLSLTSLSDQSLTYMKSGGLVHKFLTLGEAVHNDTVEHQIREMLSSKKLSRLVTVKDPKTGELTTKLQEAKAIVAAAMSTTGYDVNPENASRCFVITLDESDEQTRMIHQHQRSKYTLSNQHRKENLIPKIISKHHSAQRLLKNILIVNPYSQYLNFPVNRMRTRRDHERFMDLIACIAHLRQYQKTIMHENGKDYIFCDLKDYSYAYEIMVKKVLARTLSDFSPSDIQLYDMVKELAKKKASEDNVKMSEVVLTQREIRDYSCKGHEWVKFYLRRLVDYEAIIKNSAGRGSKGLYLLSSDDSLLEPDFKDILTPEHLKEELLKNHLDNLIS